VNISRIFPQTGTAWPPKISLFILGKPGLLAAFAARGSLRRNRDFATLADSRDGDRRISIFPQSPMSASFRRASSVASVVECRR
jgi:hypothetical protein